MQYVYYVVFAVSAYLSKLVLIWMTCLMYPEAADVIRESQPWADLVLAVAVATFIGLDIYASAKEKKE